MDEIRIGEKTYISSKRAAEITGYAKDYVGQLCREGHIEAKMVGRSWYVYEPSIREHRFGKEEASAQAPEAGGGSAQVDAVEAESAPVSAAWEEPRYHPEPVQPIPTLEEAKKGSQMLGISSDMEPSTASLTDMQQAWKEWFDQKQAQARTQPPQTLAAEPDIPQEQPFYTPEPAISRSTDEESVPTPAPAWNFDEIPGFTQEDETEEPAADAEEPVALLKEAEETEESVPVPITMLREPEPSVPAPIREPGSIDVPLRKKAIYYGAPAQMQNETGRVVFERIVAPDSKRPTVQASGKGKKARSAARTGGTAIARALLAAVAILSVAVGVIGSGMIEPYVDMFARDNKIIDILVGDRTIKPL